MIMITSILKYLTWSMPEYDTLLNTETGQKGTRERNECNRAPPKRIRPVSRWLNQRAHDLHNCKIRGATRLFSV